MENLENIIINGMFWLGVTGVSISIIAGIRNFAREIKECTYYDNTGLLDNPYSKFYSQKRDR